MAKRKPLIDDIQGELDAQLTTARVVAVLRRNPATTDELRLKLKCTEKALLAIIKRMQKQSTLVYQFGDRWSIESTPAPTDKTHVYNSRPDGTYLFGFSGDQHLCSKYARLDVLEDLYDKFEERGVDRVFNTGNWIDGEAVFNKHDLLPAGHGLESQLSYLADNFPQRSGIKTYAVAGDDHEGWYAQRFGIDIGARAADTIANTGRKDWIDLGYMECFIRLKHAKTKKESQMLVAHPGGGSAYALSYSIQKIVESLEGGEKPAVGLWGHYHKMMLANIRNVWCVQTGCTQDSTPFMRKKRLEAHVGGGICKLTQDEKTGAIVSCQVEFFRYFNTGYYNNRWSHGGPVTLPERI